MKIDKHTIGFALDHITQNGDTDIFPFPFELKFYKNKRESIIDALANIDVSNHSPLSLIESLIPKTRYGFRVAHQPYPSDTIIFTALVCSIFDEVEKARTPVEDGHAFSYRKNPATDGPLFIPDRNFREWQANFSNLLLLEDFDYAIRTDISDFYMRIYRHRLENILVSLSGKTATVKKIEKFLSIWRGGQSFGIPVGMDATRLLAEAALHDMDMALISEGYWHSRYVDDMVILTRENQSHYAALAFLAKHLTENEGLSLNNQKTNVVPWKNFLDNLSPPESEATEKSEWAIERLFWAAYANDELDEEALDLLVTKDLVKELETLISEQYWDMGAIRIVLHAMRLTANESIAKYVRDNLNILLPFAKDICLLLEHFTLNGIAGFENISGELVQLILSESMRPLDCGRAWFLELGVRDIVQYTPADIRRLDGLTGTLDIRQIHLLRWRIKDVNYFRSKKSRVNEIQSWAQPSFIYGASCLPKDEYSHWVRSLKSRLQFPLAKEFCDWCLESYGNDLLKSQKQDPT
ncbi:RNA-directed DNA polymerase [Brucella sp. NBRC 12950]|uniref:RNA-directed DNA polymerase n=1 Tax=Brucella sp. NBRC 12950 TaxID=2994518 RepID=UPI0024A2375E|nr:RNA-directed DNA polymerase [Brucella sp. NBRC 12950]GLU28890.1 reverse transcriptase [Brucella sp. NBRC 12950]